MPVRPRCSTESASKTYPDTDPGVLTTDFLQRPLPIETMWRIGFSCRNHRIGTGSMMIFSRSGSVPVASTAAMSFGLSTWSPSDRRPTQSVEGRCRAGIRLAPTATTDGNQGIWHIEEALCAAIGDRLGEKPELLPDRES